MAYKDFPASPWLGVKTALKKKPQICQDFTSQKTCKVKHQRKYYVFQVSQPSTLVKMSSQQVFWEAQTPPEGTASPQDQGSDAYLSLVLICSALASIFAPMSPMPFPLMSTLVREVLLPRALMMMVTSALSFESARDKDCRGYGGGADITQH